ncbi:type III-A CRISPR-associated RAMP protein Csm4 [Leptolyngbya sp. 'hensonii']|uniref:type III-A CRISPR-associated RAMP protein Csm4 n=1 Tax=Leptolyngbya sp. 'hensonii' TaxID=1922337 RepID=UPI0009502061|nr:type III-A CRISPR-associated RAMP protein Csm4 [Leptolyngbya sp. 'hensonii']OLP19173.1 type III-A CRISPR-associated RAMP protein Csm4 [Leptolyngbya sp. 'hensonii']
MKRWKIVKLKFGQNPVHFGELGIGLEETSERVRSDTLFSALITIYARLGYPVENLLDRFQTEAEPPFRLSSTFIYREVNNQSIYYLPRPVALPKNYPAGEDDMDFAKTFKGLKFLPLEIWQKWYQGEGFTARDRCQLIAKTKKNDSGFKGQTLDQAGTFDYGKAFEKHKLPKVAIDRTTSATNFYHTGFVHYQSEQNGNRVKSLSGLYFLLHLPEANSALEEELHTTLNFLGEEGLGGERSSGAGRFEAEWLDLPSQWNDLITIPEANRHSLLSVFWDDAITAKSSLFQEASYELQERGGWITSPFSGRQQRRKSVQMFVEGSVFSDKPQGKLADVTPENFNTHKIYRSGIAVSLPVKA